MKYMLRMSLILLLMRCLLLGSVQAAPATQPSLSDLIDICSLHADDQFNQLQQAGIASVLSPDDQKWLNSRVDETQKKLHDFYQTLKTTHQPAERYRAMDISDTSDGVPFNLATKLTDERKDLAAQLGSRGFFKAGAIVPAAVMLPPLLQAWLDSAKIPPAASAKIMAVAQAEAKQIAAAGAVLAADPNETPVALAYAKQKMASRAAIWDGITNALSVDQHKALAAAMDEKETMEAAAIVAQLLQYREARHWAAADVPAASLADSEHMNSFEAAKDERVSLVQAEDKRVLFTGALKKDQSCGFVLDFAKFQAYANDQNIPIEPQKHVYYWVAAAIDTPVRP